MKKQILFILMTLSFATPILAQKDVRIKETFDFDWLFHLGEDSDAMKINFTPKNWKWNNIQLPHDYSIIQDFKREIGGASGYLPGGIGLYRKEFTIPSSYKGKNVSILFDGVYHNATIYLNEKKIGNHRYGYTSFEIDLTDHLNYGGMNTLLVHVDRTEESRWYTGSGIYRHTWLQVTDPVRVATWGTYVTTPEVTKESARIRMVTSVVNSTSTPQNLEITQMIVDEDNHPIKIKGKKIQEETKIRIEANDTTDVEQAFSIAQPRLWSLEDPYRYFIETTLKIGNKVVDIYRTPFGIRTIRFDAQKGFFLNDKNMKMKGVCLHADAGCLGVAVPDRSYERRLEILKEFGCNAIRCSHNPPSPEFLDMCDRMGFLVIDEAFDKWKSGYYEKFFDSCWKQDIGDMVIRDRNHPCIVMWSVGNEVQEAWSGSIGIKRAKMLQDFVHQLEPTRPVTIACQSGFNPAFGDVPDILGYNYMEPRMLEDRKKNPNRICFVSEAFPYYSGDNPKNVRCYLDRNPWNFVLENDFLFGSFIWAGVDYIGEASGWPSKGWPSCLFNLCMFERTAAGYHRSVWNDKPMVRLAVVDPSQDITPGKDHWQFPTMVHHWNMPYPDIRTLEIRTMTNCDEVKLIAPSGWAKADFLPRKAADYENNTIKWNIPYRKGKVLAIGYKNGKEVCRDSIVTSGNAHHAIVTADRNELKADGQDLSHLTVELFDKDGIPVQTDDRLVTVSIEGEGKFLGIDNGDLRREKSFQGNKLKTYFGKALAIVQSNRKAGTLKVKIDIQGIPQPYYTDITIK
ncbi:glycoside hydrolase family 2 TIM barrel-domain containing protein [Bacteroides difficilis]|uniref:glycoside hydrolase family 2 TIM barrel-domain containing protein n=1 Tax=Bacteroides difficilis TaxID=2763021 RepID=UPI003AACCCAF